MDTAYGTDRTEPAPSSTVDRILDEAQRRIQRCGYNAVSYGDLAEALDVTTAAVHYHFPSKGDLGQAVVARYRRINSEKRATIQTKSDALRDQLWQYVDLYADMLEDGSLCLCGVLASDDATLPDGVRREVQQFFEEQESWLTRAIREAKGDDPLLNGYETPRQIASLFLSTVQGAMFTARAHGATERYEEMIRPLIDAITG